MPERVFLFESNDESGTPDFPDRVVAIGQRLRLRPLDGTTQTRYDRWGKRYVASVKIPEIKASAITELYGFHAEFVEAEGTTIRFQVSNDGGSTFLRWNGTSWVDDGQWSTREEVDAGIPNLEMPTPKRLQFRVQLTPSPDGSRGPELKSVSVFYELRYRWDEDLSRSLKRYLESTFAFAGLEVVDVVAADSQEVRNGVTISDPVEVYNLSTDPERLKNVGQGVVGQRVQFATRQNGRLEIAFRARPPILLTVDGTVELSQSPAVVVDVVSTEENKILRDFSDKVDWRRTDLEVRIRPHPVWELATVKIQVQSGRKREAKAMAEALAEVLQYDVNFASLATGEDFIVKGLSPVVVGDVIGEGLYVQEATVVLTGRHWLAGNVRRVPIATEVDVSFGITPPTAARTDELSIES